MPNHRLPLRVTAALVAVLLLANVSFAATFVSASPRPNPAESQELPVYMQLLVYVSQLLREGQEVPKALLNKIAAYYKSGK
jgi:hypothetical protein